MLNESVGNWNVVFPYPIEITQNTLLMGGLYSKRIFKLLFSSLVSLVKLDGIVFVRFCESLLYLTRESRAYDYL